MSRIARERGTFDHRSGSARLQSLTERNAINTGALFLFWELCSVIDDETLLALAEASAYIGLAYILLDHLVDNQTEDPASIMLLQLSFHDHGIRKLRQLFTSDHSFWSYFDRLTGMLRSSLLLEVECRLSPRKYTEERFLNSTYGKVSPAAISTAALVMLNADLEPEDQNRAVSTIERGLFDLISAGQLAHDTEEWKSDLLSREMTYFLSTCANTDYWIKDEWPSEDQLGELIFETRNDVVHFMKAEQWFVRARETIDELGQINGLNLKFENWSTYIDYYIDQATRSIQ